MHFSAVQCYASRTCFYKKMSDGEYDELLRVLQGVEFESEFGRITEDSESEEYDS